MEDTNMLTVDDVTVEELSEYTGADTVGTVHLPTDTIGTIMSF